MPRVSSAVDKTTMRAALGRGYGPVDEMISVEDGVSIPRLSDLPPRKRKNFLLIRTLAVSLAPGDCRVLSGLTRELQGPPSFPYVPGGDCCGIVVELPEDGTKRKKEAEDPPPPFDVGDIVAARFVEGPRDALAEYALVHRAVCDKVPDGISAIGAAALAGATPAVSIADRIRGGERVLILGAGGGMGSHVCQAVRERGASYVAGAASSGGGSGGVDRLLEPPLSCDRAVDYEAEDPFAVREFKDDPFDVIVDLAGGGWLRLLEDAQGRGVPSIVKPASRGGRYLTTTPDDPIFELHSVWGALNLFLFPSLWRAVRSRSWARSRLPGYTFAMSLPRDRAVMTRTLELAGSGKLRPVVDPRGPFPFTSDGVRAAFRLQESRHPHGKVIVEVMP